MEAVVQRIQKNKNLYDKFTPPHTRLLTLKRADTVRKQKQCTYMRFCF